jgi:hypothetical protein
MPPMPPCPTVSRRTSGPGWSWISSGGPIRGARTSSSSPSHRRIEPTLGSGADPLTRLSRFALVFRLWGDVAIRNYLFCKSSSATNRRKSAVVKTLVVFRREILCIISSRHVSARHDPQEGRQRAPLLEHGREQAPLGRAGDTASRALSGGDQRLAGTGVA